jgi:hypothetical protein
MISSTIDPARVGEGPRAYLEDRQTLGHFARKTIEKGEMEAYRQEWNVRSLDGCGGLKVARRQNREWMKIQDCLIWLRRVIKQWEVRISWLYYPGRHSLIMPDNF